VGRIEDGIVQCCEASLEGTLVRYNVMDGLQTRLKELEDARNSIMCQINTLQHEKGDIEIQTAKELAEGGHFGLLSVNWSRIRQIIRHK